MIRTVVKGWIAVSCLFGACVAVFAQSNTEWTIIGNRDDFTDESYFMILPAFSPPVPATNGEPSIVEDHQAKIRKQLVQKFGEEKAEQLLKSSQDKMDAMKETFRQGAEMQAIARDYSYFLRPFVAYDNGVLLAGVTTFGEVSRSMRGQTTTLHSILGAMAVQFRVDQGSAVSIDSANNPPMNLPGASAQKAAQPPANAPAGMESVFAQAMAKQSPYAAVSGEGAQVLLEQMLAGQVVKIRRKPDPESAGLGDSVSASKSFVLGPDFKAAIEKVGLRKNEKTGKWELDPAKSESRKAIIAASQKSKP